VRSGVAKITAPGQLCFKEINERINELIKASIHSEGVISLFADAPEFSIFDSHYLKMIQNMDQKNLAAEMLRRLLSDGIKAYMRTNLVKAELFSEKMDKLMKVYRNSLITNAERYKNSSTLRRKCEKQGRKATALGLMRKNLRSMTL
jgi:type I restriction enzyme R subunit